jgi:molybdopterin molybdotransferase
MISYNEALSLTLAQITPLPAEAISIAQALGRVLAEDLVARVDSPSANVSFKDGYAVKSQDIAQAAVHQEVCLQVVGNAAAGSPWNWEILHGQAVRILSGAVIPQGADAVLSDEFTRVEGDRVIAKNDAAPGRNILLRGMDVRCGQKLVSAGEVLYPTRLGLLAAAGYETLQVTRRPRVAILATGDEVVAPGLPLMPGKLYASNLVTLAAWCQRFGFGTTLQVLPDDPSRIQQGLLASSETCDAILTSGGAWKGDRDLVVHLLDELGWKEIYHRVRMGPGKAVGFGSLAGKPVFCLPGGPPSNHIAFLELALPGLQRLSGWTETGLPYIAAQLAETIAGQPDWTQFVHGRMERRGQSIMFIPTWKEASRLSSMANSDAVAVIPEGVSQLLQGEQVLIQQLIGG